MENKENKNNDKEDEYFNWFSTWKPGSGFHFGFGPCHQPPPSKWFPRFQHLGYGPCHQPPPYEWFPRFQHLGFGPYHKLLPWFGKKFTKIENKNEAEDLIKLFKIRLNLHKKRLTKKTEFIDKLMKTLEQVENELNKMDSFDNEKFISMIRKKWIDFQEDLIKSDKF